MVNGGWLMVNGFDVSGSRVSTVEVSAEWLVLVVLEGLGMEGDAVAIAEGGNVGELQALPGVGSGGNADVGEE